MNRNVQELVDRDDVNSGEDDGSFDADVNDDGQVVTSEDSEEDDDEAAVLNPIPLEQCKNHINKWYMPLVPTGFKTIAESKPIMKNQSQSAFMARILLEKYCTYPCPSGRFLGAGSVPKGCRGAV